MFIYIFDELMLRLEKKMLLYLFVLKQVAIESYLGTARKIHAAVVQEMERGIKPGVICI